MAVTKLLGARVKRVEDAHYIKEEGSIVRIGALTRHAKIRSDPLVERSFALLSQAAAFIGDVQVRHRGTIGGSLVHADPAADYLPVMLVLGAQFRRQSA